MLGVFVQILITWLTLWFYKKESPLALGLKPNKDRIRQFSFGFLIATSCSLLYYLWFSLESNTTWSVNPSYEIMDSIYAIKWTLTSVLFEELIFRGALLYIGIKILGEWKAIALSTISFGVYHWFSYGLFGSPREMIFVFFVTGLWGWIFAYSFAKTKSLYLPIALHLATNLVTIVIFSKGPIGKQFLLEKAGNEIDGWISLAIFLFQTIPVPLIIYLLIKKKKYVY